MTTTLEATRALDEAQGHGQSSVTLGDVNANPAQTWNWLKNNDVAMRVPTPAAADPMAEVPAAARRIACGAGEGATQWLDASARARRVIVVPEGTVGEPVSVTLDAAAGQVAQTTLYARPGSVAHVSVVVAHGVGSSVVAERDEREHAEGNEELARRGERDESVTDDVPATSGHALRIHAEAGSRVYVTLLVALDGPEQYLDSLGVTCDERSRVSVRQYVIGAGTCALGSQVELAGDRSRLDLSLRYLAGAGERLDLNYLVPVRGRKARANLDMTGVLTDDAHKALRATIDLVHGCKGAKAAEKETVLVAGDDVVNKTLPTILCDEDDVEGSHGAAIGSVGPDQLAYLADRGLTEDEAKDLFCRAIVDDAANTLGGGAADAVVSWARRELGQDAADEIADALELREGTEREAE